VFHEASERARSTRENRRAPKRSREIPFLIVPITASGPQGVQPLVHRIMWVREVGKIDLKPREKGWLFGFGTSRHLRASGDPEETGGCGSRGTRHSGASGSSEGAANTKTKKTGAVVRGRFPKRPRNEPTKNCIRSKGIQLFN